MRLKPIIKLCKETKDITLFNFDNCQWVTNGYAIYPLTKMPILDEDTIFTVFEIPEDKKEGYSLNIHDEDQFPVGFSTINVLPKGKERLMDKSTISITVHGDEYFPYKTTKGIALIQTKYLDPFKDITDLELYERYTQDNIYIAAKSGMILQGIILPSNSIINEKFCSEIQDLASRCCSVMVHDQEEL